MLDWVGGDAAVGRHRGLRKESEGQMEEVPCSSWEERVTLEKQVPLVVPGRVHPGRGPTV